MKNQSVKSRENVGLKKRLSTLQILLYGVGTMLGAGIYVLVGKVAGYAGSLAPLSFVIAGVLAGLTAYSYSLLAPRFPLSGGEIVYVRQAMRSKPIAVLVGWGVIFTGFISAAAIIKGFVAYLNVFVEIPETLVIIGAMLILTLIAIWGISESLNVIGLITIVEVVGLVFVIIMAGVEPVEIRDRFSELFIKAPGYNVLAVFQGAFLAFYAFVGFEDLANVAEEARNPKKSMPIAIMGSLVIALALYILVAMVAVLSLPLEVLSKSDAPMAAILEQKGENYVYFISLISLISVINGVLAQIIMGSRVLYGMSSQGGAPKFLKRVHRKFRTPVIATILMTTLVTILAIIVPIVKLANATSYVIISVFVLVNVSQVILASRDRKRKVLLSRKFWLPLIGAVLCLVFLFYKTIASFT